MPTTYSQIPIRCRLSIISNPPAYPIDDNTGEAPRFWRGQDVEVQVGIFNSVNIPIDLSNVSELQLTIRESSTSPYAYASTLSGTIIPVISYSSWSAGTAQQASFDLTAALTDLPLEGQQSMELWMQIVGYTSTGTQLVYGAGPITVYNPGAYSPPSLPGVVAEQSVSNSTGNTTILPVGQVNTVFVNVTGAASTRNILLAENNMLTGATARLTFAFPATAGIVVNVRNDVLAGSILANFTTDGEQLSAVMDFVYDGSTWVLTGAAVPAF